MRKLHLAVSGPGTVMWETGVQLTLLGFTALLLLQVCHNQTVSLSAITCIRAEKMKQFGVHISYVGSSLPPSATGKCEN